MAKQEQTPYSMEEHIEGAKQMVQDHSYENWYRASWRSLVKGIGAGFTNWCDSLRQNAAKNPMMVFGAFTFLFDQIKVAIYLKEAIASRDYSELYDLVDWVDSTADNIEELQTWRTGADLAGNPDGSCNLPLRMSKIAKAAYKYNSEVRRHWLRDSRVFRIYSPQLRPMVELSACQYSDWEVEWGSNWKVFLEAATGFFDKMSDDSMVFRVEAWSLCGMISVFGSHPEEPQYFCSEPVCLIPIEQFMDKDVHGQAAVLEQAYDRAVEQWSLNADVYYQSLEEDV